MLCGEDVKRPSSSASSASARSAPNHRDGWQDASRNLEVIYHGRDQDLREIPSDDAASLAVLMPIENLENEPSGFGGYL